MQRIFALFLLAISPAVVAAQEEINQPPAGAAPSAALSCRLEIADGENAGSQRHHTIDRRNRTAEGVAAVARAFAAGAGAAVGGVLLQQGAGGEGHRAVAEIKTPGGQGWHVPRGRPGLVTVFVMVCERPLPLDVDAELARWMAPKDQAPKLIMFENGMEVQQGKDHLPQIIDQIEHGNPRQRARRIQDLLKTKLQRNYKNSWAMAFDHPGS